MDIGSFLCAEHLNCSGLCMWTSLFKSDHRFSLTRHRGSLQNHWFFGSLNLSVLMEAQLSCPVCTLWQWSYSGYEASFLLCNLLLSPNLLMVCMTKEFGFVFIWPQHIMPAAVLKTPGEVLLLHCVSRSEERLVSCDIFEHLVVMKLTFNRWFWNMITTTKLC